MLIYFLNIHNTSTISTYIVMISCVDVLGLGPLGAPGPRCRIRVVHVTTYCQASCLQSGKPSAVMKLATYCQASYCQASYLLSGKPSAVSEMHPKGTDMHPRVSAYFCTQQPHTCTQLYKHFSKRNLLNMLI